MESFKSYIDLIASFFQNHLVLFGLITLVLLLLGIAFASFSQVKAKMDVSQENDELPKKNFFFRHMDSLLFLLDSNFKITHHNCITALKESLA